MISLAAGRCQKGMVGDTDQLQIFLFVGALEFWILVNLGRFTLAYDCLSIFYIMTDTLILHTAVP
jgi:hypothetical protein